MTTVLRSASHLLRRLATILEPDAVFDAINDQRRAVRSYADLTQPEAARLALLIERVGDVAMAVRVGHVDARDALLYLDACVIEWLEAIGS